MQCVTYGFYTEAWQEQLYTTLTLIFMFILPLIALVVTYVSTVITISREFIYLFFQLLILYKYFLYIYSFFHLVIYANE